jgi:hypothetical protein
LIANNEDNSALITYYSTPPLSPASQFSNFEAVINMDYPASQFFNFESVGNMNLSFDSSFLENELSLLNVYPNVQFGIFGLKDNYHTQHLDENSTIKNKNIDFNSNAPN